MLVLRLLVRQGFAGMDLPLDHCKLASSSNNLETHMKARHDLFNRSAHSARLSHGNSCMRRPLEPDHKVQGGCKGRAGRLIHRNCSMWVSYSCLFWGKLIASVTSNTKICLLKWFLWQCMTMAKAWDNTFGGGKSLRMPRRTPGHGKVGFIDKSL